MTKFFYFQNTCLFFLLGKISFLSIFPTTIPAVSSYGNIRITKVTYWYIPLHVFFFQVQCLIIHPCGSNLREHNTHNKGGLRIFGCNPMRINPHNKAFYSHRDNLQHIHFFLILCTSLSITYGTFSRINKVVTTDKIYSFSKSSHLGATYHFLLSNSASNLKHWNNNVRNEDTF